MPVQQGRPPSVVGICLDDLPDMEPIPHPPFEFHHIILLIVVVQDDFGRYLLLEQLLYVEEHPDDGPLEAPLVLPYKEYDIPRPASPRGTVGAVQQYLNSRQMSQKTLEKDAERAAWQLGLTNAQVKPLSTMTVLKPSIRVPEQWLAIRFHPFMAYTDVDDAARRNLADPEARRGLVHLPLDDLDRAVETREVRGGGTEWWFRGKPIAYEVQRLLAPERRIKLLEHTVRLPAEHFCRDETGLIVYADLARWGTALQAAKQPRNAIGVDGIRNVDRFLASTNAAFHRFLSRIGPTYPQGTGDAILAVFPERVHDQQKVLSRLWPAWLELLGELEKFNHDLRDSGIVLGSRLVVHYGPYKYGRIGQALSYGPQVTGESIVQAVRLEQGLANLVQANGSAAQAEDGWRHTLVVSEAAQERYGDALGRFTGGLESEGLRRLRAKELELYGHVWRFGSAAL